jgi:predicted GNAT superfamily acetyltransferase
LINIEDMRQVEQVQRTVWPGSEVDIIPAHLLMALAHNGGILIGAFMGSRLVGFVMGFLGTDQATPERVAMARLEHYSHQLGVHPDFQGQGLGLRLKNAQREAALKEGVRLITWTYDPLLSRNAHLNIRLLGAICARYYRNFYGEMRDGLNVGLPSDRFSVEWWLTSTRVVSRLENARKPLDLAHFLGAGALKVNPTSLGAGDMVRPPDQTLELHGPLGIVEIPSDFQRLKEMDPSLAEAWRVHTRGLFEHLFEAGYIVTDFIYHAEEQVPRSYYILSHGESKLG